MENPVIRKVTIDDLKQLEEIGQKTFIETYASFNSEENMKNYIVSNFSTEQLKVQLSDGGCEFYFVELSSSVIGYIKINFGPSQTDIKDEKALEIERIYVLKEFQGNGIGKLFYDKALEIAKQKRLDYIWLGVWDKNLKAIKFYEKNGFMKFDEHTFMLGEDKQTDFIMKLQLN